MKSKILLLSRSISLLPVLGIFMLLVSFLPLVAQTTADFSGKWEFDKKASSAGLTESNYDGSVIMTIKQTVSSISISETWLKPGNPDFNTAADSYTLDGKEQVQKHEVGTSRKSAKWSADKKVLIITNLDIQTLKGKLENFLVTDSFTLSADGKTLTIERYSKNPVLGESTVKKVYHKK